MYRDIAVIGAGAVGLNAARQLADAGMDVVLVEAGGKRDAARDSIMSSLHWDRKRHDGSLNGWTTGMGGTTQLWGGQLWAWENYEFEPRDYVSTTLWPTNRTELQPFYEEFLRNVGAGTTLRKYSLESPMAAGTPSGNSPAYTKHSAWLPWRKRNLFRTMKSNLIGSRNLTILPDHVATDLDLGSSDRATVHLADATGSATSLSCRLLILASGTLGNVRLLQLSQASMSPWLGRGFMDHASARYATFVVKDPTRFVKAAGARYEGTTLVTPRHVMQPGFALDNQLTNAYAHWRMEIPQTSSYAIVREALRSRQRGNPRLSRPDTLRLLRHGPRDLLFGAYCAAVLRRRPVPHEARLHLYIDVEQPPRYESEIAWTRAGAQDSLNVSWATGVEEDACFRTFGKSLFDSLDLDALGVRLADHVETPQWQDTIHMMGGARISTSEQDGVVNSDLALHGHPNILVLGASAFPTGGVANPTMTSAALALRATATATARL